MAKIDNDGRGMETAPLRSSVSADSETPPAVPTGGAHALRKPPAKKAPLPLWQEVLVLLATALILAIVVKTFFVQAFYIPSGSMEPTLQGCEGCSGNDRILVQKVSYWTGDVHRGDIVVFDDPGGWLNVAEQVQPSNGPQRLLEVFGLFPTGGHLVKRVIGIGGDRVRCCDRNGDIVVNGAALEETYLPRDVAPSDTDFDVTVPDDHLWVMGDNRSFSEDSRAHRGDPGGGFVPGEDVVGKVWAIIWPSSRLEIIDRPDVFNDSLLDGAAP